MCKYSRQAGHRFGPKLPQVEPYIFAHSEDPDEELREHLLQALEAFVLKCPKEVTPHIQKVYIQINLSHYIITTG